MMMRSPRRGERFAICVTPCLLLVNSVRARFRGGRIPSFRRRDFSLDPPVAHDPQRKPSSEESEPCADNPMYWRERRLESACATASPGADCDHTPGHTKAGPVLCRAAQRPQEAQPSAKHALLREAPAQLRKWARPSWAGRAVRRATCQFDGGSDNSTVPECP